MSVNVAIVGCGNIAATHAEALRQLGQPLVAVVDRSQEKAEAFARQWGAGAAYDQLDAVLGDGVDCVHLCTPPALHYPMVKAILSAGKHVVCEKPLCLDAGEAKELAELAAAKGVVGAVNFNVRYHAACQQARQTVSSPDFGPVHLISGSYKQEFHALPAPYLWRYQPQLAGNMRAVTEIGSHWIDLARYWTGLEIQAVSATFGKFSPQRMVEDGMMYPDSHATGERVTVDTEDAAVVTFRFDNGALGSMLLSEVSHGRTNEVQMDVSSGTHSVWWNSEDPYRLSQSTKNAGIQSQVYAFSGGFPNTFTSFFEEVYKAINHTGEGDFPSLLDGYRNVAVCEAIYQSASHHSAWTAVD